MSLSASTPALSVSTSDGLKRLRANPETLNKKNGPQAVLPSFN
ncbi:hypothetical protein [uncultured Hydrogenophaga sp.]|nr:hypothetical protein [uncultured Hydrogenophaga sp.]